MVTFRTILCPIDFSDHSRRAFDHALAIARWYGSTMTVLHVFATTGSAYAPGAPAFEPLVLTRAERDHLLAEMKRFTESAPAQDLSVELDIREGDTAREILDAASEREVDLLVMGTHGRSGFERLLLGSITEKVLRRASCPVLTVPRHSGDTLPAGPVLFKQILCPVDFSDPSMQALKYARSLAQEAAAHLTILHVLAYDLPTTPDLYDIAAEQSASLTEFRRQREDEARRRLGDALQDSVGPSGSVETLLVHGKPSREIIRLAAERQADVIVMGVQGRGAADLLLLGSTTNHVVRAATCPVLTLRFGGN
jgi:nucleotide-binding universal stress UspA family protein